MDLGHSDKHFNYNTRKKGSARKNFGYLLLEKLKNCILNTEVVAWRCSVKKVFLEISENSQENTCAGVFSKQSWRPQTSNFIKKETLVQVFSCEFSENSKNTFSYGTPRVAASVIGNLTHRLAIFPKVRAALFSSFRSKDGGDLPHLLPLVTRL